MAGGPGGVGLQWLKAQHTTAYSPGSSMTSQFTNFLTALLLWARRRPRLRRPPLPKVARNTRMHRSRRWLSPMSERLWWQTASWGLVQCGRGPILTEPPACCPPAALLEKGKLQRGSLQHGECRHTHWPAGRAGEAALHPRLLPVRVHLADVHGIEVPGWQDRSSEQNAAPCPAPGRSTHFPATPHGLPATAFQQVATPLLGACSISETSVQCHSPERSSQQGSTCPGCYPWEDGSEHEPY